MLNYQPLLGNEHVLLRQTDWKERVNSSKACNYNRPIKTRAIMGLRENFGQDDCGIQSGDPQFRDTVETQITRIPC